VKLSILNQVFVDKSEYFNSKQLSLRISVSPRKDVEVRLSGSERVTLMIAVCKFLKAIASKFAHQFPASMVSTPAPSLILMDDLRFVTMLEDTLMLRQIHRHAAAKVLCVGYLPRAQRGPSSQPLGRRACLHTRYDARGSRMCVHAAADGGYRDRYKLWRYSPKDV